MNITFKLETIQAFNAKLRMEKIEVKYNIWSQLPITESIITWSQLPRADSYNKRWKDITFTRLSQIQLKILFNKWSSILMKNKLTLSMEF